MTATTLHPAAATGRGDPASRVTRSLLGYGVLAGVVYLVVGLIEGATRDGFEFDRHALSLLSNGPWGWVHRLDLAIGGGMVILAAIGVRRAVRDGVGHRWLPRLVAAYGIGMIVAAMFNADPMDGFLGTPDGPPGDPTFHGMMHMAASSLAFVSLAAAAAAVTVARRLRHSGHRVAGAASALAALIAVAGFATTTIVGIWVSVITMWVWLAVVSIGLSRTAATR